MVLEYRLDPTKNSLVIIASKRAKRPTVRSTDEKPACPFCPGYEKTTPKQVLVIPEKGPWKVRVFPNKFGFLSPDKPFKKAGNSPAFGYHEVIVATPKHGQLFQDFSKEHLSLVFDAWKDRYQKLSGKKGVKCVFLFCNHGPKGGASIDHEHSQITALPFAPPILAAEYAQQAKAKPCEYCKLAQDNARVVCENKGFAAVCPAFSRFAYETWIVPKEHKLSFLDFNQREADEFMELLAEVVRRIYPTSPNYNIAFHQSSLAGKLHFHAEVYPRKDTWAGFELGAGIVVNATGDDKAREDLRKTPGLRLDV